MDSETLSTSVARQSLSSQKVNLRVVDTGRQARVNQEASMPAQNKDTTGAIDQEAVKERLEDSVSQLNDLVKSVQRDLQFSIDDFSGRTVITVLDSKTAEIIRQIPSDEVLALAKNIESMKGVLFSAEV